MIAFIEETVLPDYGTYADSGEQYNEDASYVSEVMNEFTEKTENLKNIMNNVVESIEGIAKAVEELFDVEVAKVNTINVRGKFRRQGRHEGYTPSWKKAIVTLTEKSKTIEFFEDMM